MSESIQNANAGSGAVGTCDGAEVTAPSSTKSPTEAKYDESTEYCDPTADVHLISSDQTIFRVHSYHLMAHSVVFRSMFEDCTTVTGAKEILLVDNDIEGKQTVNDFLNLACRAQGLDLTDRHAGNRLYNLVKFVLKYDCMVLVELVRNCLRASLRPNRSVFAVFCAGAIMDDVETCRLAIPYAGIRSWSGDETAVLPFSDRKVVGASCMDITGWSTWYWDLVPVAYIHALGRAYRKKGSGTKADWNAVADEFYRQMKKTDYVDQ